MRHAVGYFSDNPGYRNYFQTEQNNEIWGDLVEWKFAQGQERSGAYYFYLTDLGKEILGLEEQIRFKEKLDSNHQSNVDYLCEVYEIEL